MTSLGGYIFGLDENGDYDPTDIGVGSEGMIQFGEMALKWKEDGILSDVIDGTTAKAMFLNGEVAFMINGHGNFPTYALLGLPMGSLISLMVVSIHGCSRFRCQLHV